MNSLKFYKLRKQLFDEIDVVDKKIKEELDNILRKTMTNDDMELAFLSSSIKVDDSKIRVLLENTEFNEKLAENKDDIGKIVSFNGKYLKYFPEVNNDTEIILKAVKSNPEAIDYIDKDFLIEDYSNGGKTLLEILGQPKTTTLIFRLPKEIQENILSNDEFMLKIIDKNPWFVENTNLKLSDDLYSVAIENNFRVFKYRQDWHKDSHMAKLGVEADAGCWNYLSFDLKNDFDIAEAMITKYPSAISFYSNSEKVHPFTEDDKLVKIALNDDFHNLKYCGPKVADRITSEDIELLRYCEYSYVFDKVSSNPENLKYCNEEFKSVQNCEALADIISKNPDKINFILEECDLSKKTISKLKEMDEIKKIIEEQKNVDIESSLKQNGELEI